MRVVCFLPLVLGGVFVGVRVVEALGLGLGLVPCVLDALRALGFPAGARAAPAAGVSRPPALPVVCAGTGSSLWSTGLGSARFTGIGRAPPAASVPYMEPAKAVSFSWPGGAWNIMVGLPECVCRSHSVHASGHPAHGRLAKVGMSPALKVSESLPFPSSLIRAIMWWSTTHGSPPTGVVVTHRDRSLTWKSTMASLSPAFCLETTWTVVPARPWAFQAPGIWGMW